MPGTSGVPLKRVLQSMCETSRWRSGGPARPTDLPTGTCFICFRPQPDYGYAGQLLEDRHLCPGPSQGNSCRAVPPSAPGNPHVTYPHIIVALFAYAVATQPAERTRQILADIRAPRPLFDTWLANPASEWWCSRDVGDWLRRPAEAALALDGTPGVRAKKLEIGIRKRCMISLVGLFVGQLQPTPGL
ncbi:hypothetical protein CMEL01_16784 [Colletotrichum melonis]|uniref:Uncharacterized protein n=1 Tax=Colletotrichum melonis TaxID=1209925 RepID=A0AAI9XJZ6_9PEZI|nr:hypothetical protein CMEL01_16784 [Colletotrichum melonis]